MPPCGGDAAAAGKSCDWFEGLGRCASSSAQMRRGGRWRRASSSCAGSRGRRETREQVASSTTPGARQRAGGCGRAPRRLLWRTRSRAGRTAQRRRAMAGAPRRRCRLAAREPAQTQRDKLATSANCSIVEVIKIDRNYYKYPIRSALTLCSGVQIMSFFRYI